jgi:hypothetical protein
MKVMKTLVAVEGSAVSLMDTIRFKGQLWLVPAWIKDRSEGWSTPVRLICLDRLAHQKAPEDIGDFVLTYPLPRAVFDGIVPAGMESTYAIIERPQIRLSIPPSG